MKTLQFICTKGIVDKDNINVICMEGDVVKFIKVDEGDILVEGIVGWCNGKELNFTPKQFSKCFKGFGLTYII